MFRFVFGILRLYDTLLLLLVGIAKQIKLLKIQTKFSSTTACLTSIRHLNKLKMNLNTRITYILEERLRIKFW